MPENGSHSQPGPSFDAGAGFYFSASFLTYETEFVLFLVVLENPVLPMGFYSSHAEVKSNNRTLNYRIDIFFESPRKTPNDVRKKVVMQRKMSKIERNDE